MLPFRKRLQGWLLSRLPLERDTRLGQKRIYLLPTRFGLLLLLVAFCVWVGALNYGVSLAYALAFWIVALELVAVLMAYRQLYGLQLQVQASEPVFVGDTAACRLLLTNQADVGRRLQWQRTDGDGEARTCLLLPRTSGMIDVEMVLTQRGPHRYPAIRVWSEAPLGLVRAFSWVRPDAQVLAYPLPLPDKERHDQVPDAEAKAGTVEAGDDEFSHLAEYRHGDTPRQIAWSVLARRDVLVSKKFGGSVGEGMRQLAWQDYPAGTDVEHRLSRLCWRVLQCERAGLRYTLQLPGQAIGPQPNQRELALSALALYGLER